MDLGPDDSIGEGVVLMEGTRLTRRIRWVTMVFVSMLANLWTGTVGAENPAARSPSTAMWHGESDSLGWV
jgi:hypothetical protein